MKNRESFIFYRSFFDASKPLNETQKVALFEGIMEYALNQTETEKEPLVQAMFSLIKPQLDANHKKYENGAKGGRPKTKPKPKHNQAATKPEPNANVNVNVNENVNKKSKKGASLRLNVFCMNELNEKEQHRFQARPHDIIPDCLLDIWEKENGDSEKAQTEWKKFFEYYMNNKDCKKPSRIDWQATWRNWIIK